ncbi:hypothetical protein PR048_009194 [Dryococelus australis]|uniref:Peptidase A2 domain-containing protein n=1 Tax=Dryococelus australis TaxID=614101 RepID=A0ABQ9HZ64_9NEOP|nr:hypothetical protein PR048_009194 [Dryococelus australis]
MVDKKTSEQLQLRPKLMLEEAVLVAKQANLQSKQSLVLYHEQQHGGEVSRVQIRRRSSPQGASQQQGSFRHHSSSQQRASHVQGPSTLSEDNRCHFCGLHTPMRGLSVQPVKLRVSAVVSSGIGLLCVQLGEDQTKIRNGQNRQSENDDREDVFIGGLWLNALGTDKQTTVKIVDFEKSVNFLIDTGADVSCVPTSVVPEKMLPIAKKTEEPISGPDGYHLKVIGFLGLILETKDKQTCSKVYKLLYWEDSVCRIWEFVCFKEGRCMVAKVRGECGLASEFSKVNVPVEFPE